MYETCEIIYPIQAKKYTGTIYQRKNFNKKKGDYITYRCEIGRNKPFHDNSTHGTYESAFEYIKSYNIQHNLPIKNIINKYSDRIEVKIEYLGKIFFAIFDLQDIDLVQKYVLNISKSGKYLAVKAGVGNANKFISHIILDFQYNKAEKITVDHINRNPLDNRRKNIRLSNLYVQGNNKDRIFKAAGISNDIIDCRWIARIGSGINSKKKSFTYKSTYPLAFSQNYACALAYLTRKNWEKERDENIDLITEKLSSTRL